MIRRLDGGKYRVLPVVVSRDSLWQMDDYVAEDSRPQWQVAPWLSQAAAYSAIDAIQELYRQGVEVALLATHGRFGEDGKLQDFLEMAGLAYSGSDGIASALAIHKAAAKALMAELGLAGAKGFRVQPQQWQQHGDEVVQRALALAHKLVIKAVNSGSSLDMYIVESNQEEVARALADLAAIDEVLVEEYVSGREVTAGVLDLYNKPGKGPRTIPLAVTEIKPKRHSFFSYEAKYTADATEEVTPAELEAEVAAKVQQAALLCHGALGCFGYSRSDFILRSNQGQTELLYLETNTLPGMTKTSLLPQGAQAVGVSFAELLDHIITGALWRRQNH
jgi:D-alanine-D-alanine ligase